MDIRFFFRNFHECQTHFQEEKFFGVFIHENMEINKEEKYGEDAIPKVGLNCYSKHLNYVMPKYRVR